MMEKTTFNTDTCSTCRYSGTADRGDGMTVAVCRRYPPRMGSQFVPTEDGPAFLARPLWPQISPLVDTCGQREARAA